MLERLLRGFNLVLPGKEDQDVARRLCDVYLQDGNDARLEIIRLRSFRVHDVDGVPTAGDVEDGRVVKIRREFGRVQSRGGDEELQVLSEARDVLQQAEEDVCVQRALVRLIQHHARVRGEIGLAQELAQEHAVGHVLEQRALGRAVLKTDRVADFVAELAAHLLRDARRDRHGRDTTRLRASNLLVAVAQSGLV